MNLTRDLINLLVSTKKVFRYLIPSQGKALVTDAFMLMIHFKAVAHRGGDNLTMLHTAGYFNVRQYIIFQI